MKRIYVTPLDAKIIPLPDGNGDLPQEGKDVAATSYWYKRLADGDITMKDVEEPEEEKKVVAVPEGKTAKESAKSDKK